MIINLIESIKSISREKRGFSLVQILIGIIIAFLIFGAGASTFRRNQVSRELDSQAKILEQAILETRKKATTGMKPEGWCSADSDSLKSYSIHFGNLLEQNEYEIQANCSNGTTVSNIFKLKPNMIVYKNVKIEFDLLGRLDDATKVCIFDAEKNVFYRINISPVGSVSLKRTRSC